MILSKEFETFQRELPRLLENFEGRYVLIHGEEIVDTFASDDDAILEGRRRFGFVPILVRKIQRVQKPVFMSRNLHFAERDSEENA